MALMFSGCTGQVVEEELHFQSAGKDVFGVLYRPADTTKRYPLIIVSHGFGGSYRFGTAYARALVPKGVAVYCFDFCGGASGSRSEGCTTDMSVFTEMEDLKAVMDSLCCQEGIDPEHITLMGESQGGLVSALVAAQRKDRIERLLLFYPAFCIPDDWKKRYPLIDDMPEELDFWGMKLSHTYVEGLYDLDAYALATRYEGPVYIYHGEKDPLVNISYATKAADLYPNAVLTVFPGEGHGFGPEARQKIIESLIDIIAPR